MDLVIFDCDGVLVDSEIISAKMLISELAGMGVAIDLDYVSKHFLGRSYPMVMKVIRADFGVTLTDEFEAQYRARLMAAFEAELKPMAGVAEALAAMDVPWWVATSSSESRARRSLEIAGLAGLVADRLVTAGMVTNGKPAPDLFFLAAERAGADPSRCLVIEDSLMGILAARAAGMAIWRFTGGSHLGGTPPEEPSDARPDLRFASWAEFKDIGRELMRAGP